MTETTLIRNNLMDREGYSPYCGNDRCRNTPRTRWNGDQFTCPSCKWESGFPKDFIDRYKEQWQK